MSKPHQLKQAVGLLTGGTLTFVGHCIYSGNEKFYQDFVMPWIRVIDPETTHNIAVMLAKYRFVPKQKKPDPPILHTSLWGKQFSNPVGLAAGFDKDGVAVDGMLKTGFGFVEVGSVTPKPQPGNPKPRLFRLVEDKGVINRFGFNSEGHEVVYERLKQRETENPVTDLVHFPHMAEERNMLNINLWTDTISPETVPTVHKVKGVMGVNLGKNKSSEEPVNDFVEGVRKFGTIADYLVVNVSSPNTPGLRDMQGKQELEELIGKVSEERDKLSLSTKPPLLVKIAPDLTEKDKQDISDVVLKKKGRVDGLIVSNTTVSRPSSLQSFRKSEIGGLSGEPLKCLATETVKDMYRLTKGQLPIIGVGGVASGQDAYEKIRAGASLIQLYSALVYQGPPVVSRIKRELEELLQKDGYSNISEAVGADVKLGS